MRIVGGNLRGRRLAEPDDRSIRPTTDRARETLFNMLTHRHALAGEAVLDVFAGTGALGLEALSRGAGNATFIEQSPKAAGIIRHNSAALGLDGQTTVMKRSALSPGTPPQAFGLVFLDPPYGRGLGEAALAALNTAGWIAADALIVLEEEQRALPEHIAGFALLDRRNVGQSAFGFLRPAPENAPK